MELFVALFAPILLPESLYLSLYLGNKSVENTKLFLSNNLFLVPHAQLGWVNKPNVLNGNWHTNNIGIRSSSNSKIMKSKKFRVAFLGSSLTNGGMDVNNHETLSSFLENNIFEALNFGTMMYSIDQSLTLYRLKVSEFNPEYVFVEIEPDTINSIQSFYLPFRSRQEVNMPFLKNGIKYASGSIKITNLSIIRELSNIPNNSSLLDFLNENDKFYYRYALFKRLGFLPIGGGLKYISSKFFNFKQYFTVDKNGYEALKYILTQFVDETKKHNSTVVFLFFPNRKVFERKGIHNYLPDKYAQNVNFCKNNGFDIIDSRKVLRDSMKDPKTLFHKDRVHYKPMANRIIADYIKEYIISSQNNE